MRDHGSEEPLATTVDPLGQMHQDVVLVGEVVVQRGHVDTGALGDRVGVEPGQTLFVHDVTGRVEDAIHRGRADRDGRGEGLGLAHLGAFRRFSVTERYPSVHDRQEPTRQPG